MGVPYRKIRNDSQCSSYLFLILRVIPSERTSGVAVREPPLNRAPLEGLPRRSLHGILHHHTLPIRKILLTELLQLGQAPEHHLVVQTELGLHRRDNYDAVPLLPLLDGLPKSDVRPKEAGVERGHGERTSGVAVREPPLNRAPLEGLPRRSLHGILHHHTLPIRKILLTELLQLGQAPEHHLVVQTELGLHRRDNYDAVPLLPLLDGLPKSDVRPKEAGVERGHGERTSGVAVREPPLNRAPLEGLPRRSLHGILHHHTLPIRKILLTELLQLGQAPEHHLVVQTELGLHRRDNYDAVPLLPLLDGLPKSDVRPKEAGVERGHGERTSGVAVREPPLSHTLPIRKILLTELLQLGQAPEHHLVVQTELGLHRRDNYDAVLSFHSSMDFPRRSLTGSSITSRVMGRRRTGGAPMAGSPTQRVPLAGNDLIHLNRLREVLPQFGFHHLLLELRELLLENGTVLGDPHGVRDEGQQAVRAGPVGVVLLDGRLHLSQDFLLGGGGPELGPDHGIAEKFGLVADRGGEIEGSEGEEANGAADLPGGGLKAGDDAAAVEEERDAVALTTIEGESPGGLDLAGEDSSGVGEGGTAVTVRGGRRGLQLVEDGDDAVQVGGQLGKAVALDEDVTGRADGIIGGLDGPRNELGDRDDRGVHDQLRRGHLPAVS
ncbi:hypothetical protein C4D60_Mb04t04910 [Musa balbisiana]|uniref:Uncharacterized protein n=1 Tax=Musa balbisiana TaxID=52838 RepID=A0A4S8K9T2_MUSBA|nr:hypothetical protein C4D60_Mb04t04910 [Musa balbisiana]